MDLKGVTVELVSRGDEQRYQALMQAHHYLGSLPKIGETLLYIALYEGEWIALLSFSASALKCAARDEWIGWEVHHQYARLKLITNNSRFLILPDWHYPNLGSRVLAVCQKRLVTDWQRCFGHPVLLLETFVDPRFFHGTVYRADNWLAVGQTRGFRRVHGGYSQTAAHPKHVFIKPLQRDARQRLSHPTIELPFSQGAVKMTLNARQMQSLPDFFRTIPDPRRRQGRVHSLPCILAIATGATLSGMRGYKAIADWAQGLGQKARVRFGCRRVKGTYIVPSESIIRDIFVRTDPAAIDKAIQQWNNTHSVADTALAIDGKTLCNAMDEQGHQPRAYASNC